MSPVACLLLKQLPVFLCLVFLLWSPQLLGVPWVLASEEC